MEKPWYNYYSSWNRRLWEKFRCRLAKMSCNWNGPVTMLLKGLKLENIQSKWNLWWASSSWFTGHSILYFVIDWQVPHSETFKLHVLMLAKEKNKWNLFCQRTEQNKQKWKKSKTCSAKEQNKTTLLCVVSLQSHTGDVREHLCIKGQQQKFRWD